MTHPPLPLVSVVVPTFERPHRLALCLEALAAQDYPRDRFEVVVVNDGGASPVEAVAAARERIAVTLVEQENAGPAAARNRGAARARGGLLAFTDDDCAPAPDWLSRLAGHHQRRPGTLLGGAVENALPGDAYAAATQLVTSYIYEYHDRRPGARRLFTTSNLAVPAEPFLRLGGFSERFPRPAGEDFDFCARWHHAGLPSAFAADALVRHAHGHELSSFWRQHFDYGRAALHVRRRSARREGGRTRFEAPGFYAGLLAAPFRQARGAPALRLATLVILSQVATVAGAAREAFGAGRWGGDDEPGQPASGGASLGDAPSEDASPSDAPRAVRKP